MITIRTPSQRILALDLLRGLFLVIIIVDHLQRFPDLLDLLTGRGYLWVSAAEGFFFLSGLMLAMVRMKDAKAGNWRHVISKIYGRAAKLYIWSVGLTLAFTYTAFMIGEYHPGIKSGLIGRDSFGEILLNVLSFRYVYGWADFLPHYVIFLLGAPIVLWLLSKRRTDVVLAVSALIWVLSSSFTGRWQIIFYGGMVVGYHRNTLAAWFQLQTERMRRHLIRGIFVVAGTGVLASMVVVRFRDEIANVAPAAAQWLSSVNDLTALYFDKTTVPLPRLILFAAWFSALYILFRHYEYTINRWFGWLLRPLGRNSLSVYIAHSVVLFGVGIMLPYATHNLVINALITAAVILSVWIVVQRNTLQQMVRALPLPARAVITLETIATAGIIAYDALSRFVR